MIKKLYVVSGISDNDWEEIFSCLRFVSIFSDKSLKNDDLRILKNIKVRYLGRDKDARKYAQK